MAQVKFFSCPAGSCTKSAEFLVVMLPRCQAMDFFEHRFERKGLYVPFVVSANTASKILAHEKVDDEVKLGHR